MLIALLIVICLLAAASVAHHLGKREAERKAELHRHIMRVIGGGNA